jgi:hypothetical protein
MKRLAVLATLALVSGLIVGPTTAHATVVCQANRARTDNRGGGIIARSYGGCFQGGTLAKVDLTSCMQIGTPVNPLENPNITWETVTDHCQTKHPYISDYHLGVVTSTVGVCVGGQVYHVRVVTTVTGYDTDGNVVGFAQSFGPGDWGVRTKCGGR